MHVRAATADDVAAIVEMSERFYATTSYVEVAEFCPHSVEDIVALLIDTGVMLLAEEGGAVVGMVGLAVAPFPFNNAVINACEVVWWVKPEAQGNGAGKALLAAIEPACREKGVGLIQMIHLASSPPQAAAIYERMGYKPTESSYSKVI